MLGLVMLERQIKETPQGWPGLKVKAARQGPVRHMTRQFIGGECKSAVAEEIAGELVGDQDQGECSHRILFPKEQPPGSGLAMHSREALADGCVKGGVGGEPAFRPSIAPEGDHLLRFSGA